MILAVVVAIGAAAVTVWGQFRTRTLTAKDEAEAVLAKYSGPLVAAAFELQGRLYNIIRLGFLPSYLVNGDEAQKAYAVENTLYVVGQFLGWREILYRKIQLLSFSDTKRTRAVSRQLQEITKAFQTDDPELGRPFLVWRGEQRAIGERMLVAVGDVKLQHALVELIQLLDPQGLRYPSQVLQKA